MGCKEMIKTIQEELRAKQTELLNEIQNLPLADIGLNLHKELLLLSSIRQWIAKNEERLLDRCYDLQKIEVR